jgi:hypothetical protein
VLHFAADLTLPYLGERLAETIRAVCIWALTEHLPVTLVELHADPSAQWIGGVDRVVFEVDTVDIGAAAADAWRLQHFLDLHLGGWCRVAGAGARVTVTWEVLRLGSAGGDRG